MKFFAKKKERGKNSQRSLPPRRLFDFEILFQGTDTGDNDRTVNTVNIDLHVIGVKNIPSFPLSVEQLPVALIDELSRNKKKKRKRKKNGRKMDG